MANIHGTSAASYATQRAVAVATGGWTALQVGSSPLKGRLWVELQVRGKSALALAYANKNADGTFTTPTDSVRNTKIIPASSFKVEPLGDTVALYGRAVGKAGSTDSSVKVVVVEYN